MLRIGKLILKNIKSKQCFYLYTCRYLKIMNMKILERKGELPLRSLFIDCEVNKQMKKIRKLLGPLYAFHQEILNFFLRQYGLNGPESLEPFQYKHHWCQAQTNLMEKP